MGSIAITALDCNLTAASLFLLRTLEHDHTDTDSVAPSNQLFPHCGHAPWVVYASGFRHSTWAVTGGDELWVRHEGGAVNLSRGELHERVPTEAWEQAVASFADDVRAFYDASPPRRGSRGSNTDIMELEGWDAFWVEWIERRIRLGPTSLASRPAFIEDSSTPHGPIRRLWTRCAQALRPGSDTRGR